MKNALSVRSYTASMCSHIHDYHQILLTLNGYIELDVGDYKGTVSVGEGVLIKAGETHSFKASESARFVVADSQILPVNFASRGDCKFRLNDTLLSFIQFVDKQLHSPINSIIEVQLFDMFYQLINILPVSNKFDKRIERAINFIHQDLSILLSIKKLSDVSYLSETQFKKLFKECLGVPIGKYLIQVRMEKARSLLSHTDMPITQIALEVGYEDLSSFSRRFSTYYGQPARYFANRTIVHDG